MHKLPVIAIFDVGKTNKKLLLFNERYKVVHEEAVQLDEVMDEDGFACENIEALSKWITYKYAEFINNELYEVRAMNFTAYGASFVHIDDNQKVLTPLYNYLKPFPEKLRKQFYDQYGSESLISKQTASPVLGNLNSGMQLYRLKYEKPKIYAQIKYSLHLPQYLSYLISSREATDITSVGCHTQLWDFQKKKYHQWVYDEGIETKFAPIFPGDKIVEVAHNSDTAIVGIGLHDSSAALIPYLTTFSGPFILLSTGTWCISLNPFNHTPLTDLELHQDCLCYLSYTGAPVKASRLFAGFEHEQQIKRIAAHFDKDSNYFTTISYDEKIMQKLRPSIETADTSDTGMVRPSLFPQRDISAYTSYEEAYHQLMDDIVTQQVRSTKLVLSGTSVKKIFVDGGFGKNPIYMHLACRSLPGY